MEFTSLGVVQLVNDKKRIVPNSIAYYHAGVSAFPLGTKVRATYKQVKSEHSKAQHAYHFVLCGLIASHTGYTTDDVHDAMMKQAFGTKKVTLLGKTTEARESLSAAAQLSVGKAVELVNKDLEVCAELGIVVPTKEELGYLEG